MKSVNYSEVVVKSDLTIKTGEEIFDSFLSNDGGFVEKSAILLTGTPGAGKTTLAIILQRLLREYKTSLYSREMSASSVKNQMKRYEIQHENAYIADKEMCDNITLFIEELNELMPKVVIVDSLQVIMKEDYANVSADFSGFEIIQKLRNWTNKHDAVLIVVGHVNKDGEFEGRNTIQHMFDAHMEMIFDKKKNSRTLSWSKNRFGAVGKVLYYEFGEESMEFYTKEQYDILKNNKTLEEYIFEMINTFLNSINRKSSDYPFLQKEFYEKMDELSNSNKNIFEVNLETLIILKRLLNKYKI
jgi:predicted ATP-dependent serine protease